jgi:hypothetical protein
VLRNRLYYTLKPLLPRSLRMSIRRWWTVRKRKHVSAVWPIMPGSERPPAGWKGWPEGKKFAFVLTHDVEGQAGIDRVRDLMRLEMELGFRSSFNFIPEGEYTVPRELREELVANGFEVGVHDLHHDGHLFDSESEFQKKAEKINAYAKEWGAVGFRAGFMLRQLDWYHDLNIEYDASTFDTDPFEPQPDGRNTIFPFWIPAPAAVNGQKTARNGYVELPYTLAQDSTLFLLLEERTPKLWQRKLDWIAEHGGMALVNVHPDYMAFDEAARPLRTFPSSYYRELLELLQHARDRYYDALWQPLPRELAAFAKQNLPLVQPSAPTGNI